MGLIERKEWRWTRRDARPILGGDPVLAATVAIPLAKPGLREYIAVMRALHKSVYDTLCVGAAIICVAVTIAVPGKAQTPPVNAAPIAQPPPTLLPLPPAVVDNTLLIGGTDIAARKVETRMTVAVQVEGRGPFRFVVDSGADSSAVGSSIASALHLPATSQAMLHGMTASSVVERVMASELKVGESTLNNLELPVLRDEDLGAQGLLGIDALVEQRLMMDFEKRVITIEDARRPAPRMDGDIVVIARRQRGQLILTQASANGHPVDAVIDTGSEITIGNLALRDRLFKKNFKSLVSGQVVGVTGVMVTMQLAHLDELRIGPIIMRNVNIAFGDVPPFTAFGLTGRPAMFLGTDLMGNFRRISLDFRARKVRFQLKRCKAHIFLHTAESWSTLTMSEPDANAC
jgi:predicted aspartyl protease